jgi:acyl-CoA synthetase (AMP-forming)/AMP-acid ligase II
MRNHTELLTSRLELWAAERANHRALVFLGDGENETGGFSFADLHRAARETAAALRSYGVSGRPVLILAGSGLDFARAFFGCLYAGAIAVPCSLGPRQQAWERLAAIAADAVPAAAVGGADASGLLPALEGLRIPALRIDQTRQGELAPIAAVAAHAPALLQYTSGSTGSPKGVVVTHHNIASNLQMLHSSLGVHDESVFLAWLPLFHDMGLIGNLLAAIYFGVGCILMPPAKFYQKPRRWLAAIARYGATISGGPNFAYEFCVRRSAQMDLTGLDLSRWEIAFCGAELVRPATLRRFADLFAPAGFRASAFYPCYGLAEATLFVTGGEPNGGFKTAIGESGTETVSCGRPASGGHVIIVDPNTATPVSDGLIGEIWLTGDHVAAGYWRKRALSEETFEARLRPRTEQGFLRTGDLGWMRAGELYVSGRLKDLMICRGANIHPEDIEATAARAHPAFGTAGAAFSVEIGNEEQVVVVQELIPRVDRQLDAAAALAALAKAVADAHGLHLYDAVLVRSGSVPRTTSGKIRRQRCRELYRDAQLEPALGARLRRLIGS